MGHEDFRHLNATLTLVGGVGASLCVSPVKVVLGRESPQHRVGVGGQEGGEHREVLSPFLLLGWWQLGTGRGPEVNLYFSRVGGNGPVCSPSPRLSGRQSEAAGLCLVGWHLQGRQEIPTQLWTLRQLVQTLGP